MNTPLPEPAVLRRIRWWLGLFMIGLVLSGVTAFPLESEVGLLHRWLGNGNGALASSGLAAWIHTIHEGLHTTYAQYPWVAYGTDWLAFAHIIIALFFIGPFIDPVRNLWVLQAGMMSCGLVVLLAMICGPIRQIPFGWRLIDCTFGVVGIVPLYASWRLATGLARRPTKS